MLIIKRYLSFIVAFATLVYLEIFIKFPNSLLVLSVAYLFFLFLSLWYLQRSKLDSWENKIAFFLFPILFVASFIIFLIYFDFHHFFLHTVILFGSVLMWLYLESFFLKYYFTNFYSTRSFENISENIAIVTAFLFFVNFFNFRVYLEWPYFKLFNLAILFLFCLNWTQFVFNNLTTTNILVWWRRKFSQYDSRTLIYLIIIPFLNIEILLTSVFLPTNFYSLALINTIFFYIFMLFSRHHLLDQFSLKKAQKFLSLGVVILLLIFLITNWT